jgi:uncharacterized membrane protein
MIGSQPRHNSLQLELSYRLAIALSFVVGCRSKERRERGSMNWLRRYRIWHYIGSAIWIFPALGILAAMGMVRLLHEIDLDHSWRTPIDPETARVVLGTMASALFTAIVFVCSAILVAVQLASAQLTPRIIGIVFRDPIVKLSLTLLTFTFTFTLAALIRIKSVVPLLTTHIAAYGCLVSLGVFFYLIDHLGRAVRPSGALRLVARMGRTVIASVYPERLSDRPDGTISEDRLVLDGAPSRAIPSSIDGVVLAFDLEGLTLIAKRADCVIELVPQVGDHLAAADPLFRVFQCRATVSPDALRQSVVVGQERTLEQDPTFTFRIMVDIASKALSPAINDPTTAVLALDQIHHLLREVGSRHLDTGQVRDAAGRLRLFYRTPNWEDFVRLAVTEIRHFGGESIQVVRRLRAMLENLIQTVPESRRPLLLQELTLLHRTAERFFTEPEDRALADVSDFQGVGGSQCHVKAGSEHGDASTARPSAGSPVIVSTGTTQRP